MKVISAGEVETYRNKEIIIVYERSTQRTEQMTTRLANPRTFIYYKPIE